MEMIAFNTSKIIPYKKTLGVPLVDGFGKIGK